MLDSIPAGTGESCEAYFMRVYAEHLHVFDRLSGPPFEWHCDFMELHKVFIRLRVQQVGVICHHMKNDSCPNVFPHHRYFIRMCKDQWDIPTGMTRYVFIDCSFVCNRRFTCTTVRA